MPPQVMGNPHNQKTAQEFKALQTAKRDFCADIFQKLADGISEGAKALEIEAKEILTDEHKQKIIADVAKHLAEQAVKAKKFY